MPKSNLFRLLIVASLVGTPFAGALAQPSAGCTASLTPLSLELGKGIPLPRRYSNPTGERVRFTVSIASSRLFGPAHPVASMTLGPRQGTTLSESPIHPTALRTPMGTEDVSLLVTTDRTGNAIVGRCDYRLSLRPPPGVPGKDRSGPVVSQHRLNWLYQVPVRLCVIEGSEVSAGRAPGQTIAGGSLFALLETVNRQVWFPQAQIAFSSSIETGIPVIADPTPPNGGSCRRGDLDVGGFALGDAPAAAQACEAAWNGKYPGVQGVPVVFARNFCQSGQIEGGAPPIPAGLMVASQNPRTGQRGDDFCGLPRRMTPADVVSDQRRPFVVLKDPSRNARSMQHLAHELGHNLYLGHGNGLDDNRDGVAAGRRGPKRYDEYCDPAGLQMPENVMVAEDLATPVVDCATTSSLMNRSATCENLQPLQVETARAVARLMPGFQDGTPEPVLADARVPTPLRSLDTGGPGSPAPGEVPGDGTQIH